MESFKKFEQIYRRIISQQMQNLPQIKTFEQNRKQDYIIFREVSEVGTGLDDFYYDLEKLQEDLKTNNIHLDSIYDDQGGEYSIIDSYFCSTGHGQDQRDYLKEQGGLPAVKQFIKKIIFLIKTAKKRGWKFRGFDTNSHGQESGREYWIPQNAEDLNLFIDLYLSITLIRFPEYIEKAKQIFSLQINKYLKTKDRNDLIFSISGDIEDWLKEDVMKQNEDYSHDPIVDLNLAYNF